jgi:hypothetical protein
MADQAHRPYGTGLLTDQDDDLLSHLIEPETVRVEKFTGSGALFVEQAQ